MNKQDRIAKLRSNLGIEEPKKLRAGSSTTPKPKTLADIIEAKNRAYQAEMALLQQGGNDANGNELWRKLMRRRRI